MMARIAITWKKSAIGSTRRQRETVARLGLRRLNHRVEHEDIPAIRGMVDKVRHLVEVVSIDPPEGKAKTSRAPRPRKRS
jgi:large subunit ribosomal protein L30